MHAERGGRSGHKPDLQDPVQASVLPFCLRGKQVRELLARKGEKVATQRGGRSACTVVCRCASPPHPPPSPSYSSFDKQGLAT